LSRPRLLLAAAVFLACLAAYLPTLNPAFRADDSPETIAACVTLGIQHPPGYPLHTLLGRVFSLPALGAPAFRLNLMAAFFGALSCALLTAALAALLPAGAWAAAAAGGLFLGTSKTLWSQSLAAKGGIYTLHLAFTAAVLCALVAWGKSKQHRWLWLAVFLFGLGLGNHWETQVLLAPAVLAFAAVIWMGDRAAFPWRKLALPAAAFLALGLSVYAYLPLRASQSPFLNWGDPSSWSQFWWVFQRQEYLDLEVGFLKSLRAALLGGGSWATVGENWAFVQRQGSRVLMHLFGPQADLGLPAVILSVIGGWTLAREAKAPLLRALGAWCLAVALAFPFVVAFYFHLKPEMIWILDVFLIPAYLVQALLAGWGLQALWIRWRGQASQPRWAAAAVFAALALMAWPRAAGQSQARHYIAYDYGHDLLLSAKRGAVVLAEGDFNTMPIYYLQQVGGLRPDVDHITTVFFSTDWGVKHAAKAQPRLGLDLNAIPHSITGARAGDGQVLRAALGQAVSKAAAAGRPVTASLFRQVLSENVKEWEAGFRPSGLLAELNAPLTPAEDRRRLGLLKALRTRHLEFDRATLDPSPEFAVSNYGTAYLNLANDLRQRGQAAAAAPLYGKAALVTSRANLAEVYTHHGIALASGGMDGKHPDLAGAQAMFRRSAELKPLFEAYANLAGVSNQLGQATKQARYFVEAESAARTAVKLAPSSGPAWNNLAIALYYQNRVPEAVDTLRQAQALAPNDPQIQANLRALGGAR
jgi:Flp pilus assembly protein TadD